MKKKILLFFIVALSMGLHQYQAGETLHEKKPDCMGGIGTSTWSFQNGILYIYCDEAYTQSIEVSETIEELRLVDGVTIWDKIPCSLSGVKKVSLPNSLRIIKDYAAGAIRSAPIVIPSSVEEIEPFAFPFPFSLLSIANDNHCFYLENSCLIQSGTLKLIKYLGDDDVVLVPEGVKEIGTFAFFDCGEIKEIILPETVTQLDKSCIVYMDNLEHIYLPSSLTIIQDDVLCSCPCLYSVTIPDGVFFNMRTKDSFIFTGGLQRLVFEGSFFYDYTPFCHTWWDIKQIVFLDDKPQGIDFGETFSSVENCTIYYLKKT